MLRFSLVTFLVLGAAAHAQAGWADALFDELSRDFGSVPRGPVVTHPFRLVNNTNSPVRISSVRPSCSRCASARALQTYLAPGQETAILAQMDTRQFFGTKNITIYVQFDQPRADEVRLWIQATSRDDVSFTPDSLNAGKIKRGTSANVDMTVTFFGSAATKVTEVKCDSNYIQPSFKEIRRESGETAYQVSAKVRNDTPAGKWFTDIWIKTNNASIAKLRVPLTVEVESALSVSPTTVILGEVRAGTESDRKVILRGVKPFRIISITGTDQQVQVRETANESKNVHVLTVTLNPFEAGQLIRTIRVQTDLKNGGDIEFTAQADVLP